MKPRIYVACLAAYNSGIHHGSWIDADQDLEDLQNAVKDILQTSPIPHAEEYAIHDFEGFGSFPINEYSSLEKISEIGNLLTEDQGDLILELMNHLSLDSVDDARDYLRDNYAGEYDSLEDYAEQFLNDTGALDKIPPNLRYYFNYEKYSRDLVYSGEMLTIELGNKTHVFWSN